MTAIRVTIVLLVVIVAPLLVAAEGAKQYDVGF